MRQVVKYGSLAALTIMSFSVFAGKDPISWTVNRELSNPSIVGRTYTLKYTLTNELPYTLVKGLNITKNGLPSSDFSYTDGCTGQKLASGASCDVDVTFTPSSSGTKSIQLIVGGFDDNRVPLPKQESVAQGSTPASNTVYGNVDTSLPESLSIGTSSNYTITFTNGTGSTLSGVSVSVSQTNGTPTYENGCGSTLAAGKSCSISGVYAPTSETPSTQSVSSTFSYSGGSIMQSTSGSITSSSGVKAFFTGFNYLPAEMEGGSANDKEIQVQFCNNSASIITPTARSLSITTGGGSATLDTTDYPSGGAYDNCLNGALNPPSGSTPGSCCVKTAKFKPSVVGSDTQVVVTGSLTYTGGSGSPVSATTSTYLVPSLGTSRTITLVNNCSFPVWWSFSGSAVAGTSSASCPAGTSANVIDTTGECHWSNPGPNSGTSYKLAKLSDAPANQNTVTIALNSGTDPKVQWSGIVSAGLACDEDGQNCNVAPCPKGGADQSCQSGGGFEGPVTQAEFTFNIATSDSYDVEVINGFHIPISITPGSHTIADNYNCGVPGNNTAANGFGSCNWQDPSDLPGNAYYVVTGGSGDACDVTSPTCSTPGEFCGIYWITPTKPQVCAVASLQVTGRLMRFVGLIHRPHQIKPLQTILSVTRNYQVPRQHHQRVRTHQHQQRVIQMVQTILI